MVRCGIVGGTGYTGVELLRLLVRHPGVEVAVVTSRAEAGKQVSDLFPNLRGRLSLTFEAPDVARLSSCDVVFFATPNGTAMKLVPTLLEAGVKVVDLAADFRLKDPAVWEAWYAMPHACPELLEEAVYGLPEINRSAIAEARLVANPGCYPTATTLGLLPLLQRRLIDTDRIIADAKSGVSGAGRKAQVGSLFAEMGESFKAYAVQGHRHWPEISQVLGQFIDAPVGLDFVPHLLPMVRGIHVTLYGFLTSECDSLQALYETFYAQEPFVDVLPEGTCPETRSCKGANMCRMAVHRPRGGDTVIVLSVIDNLVKGAAGQAVQNMNLMFGFDEEAGLDVVALLP